MSALGRVEAYPGVSARLLFWLVPVLFTLHNFEEYLTMPPVMVELPRRIPAGIPMGILPFPPSGEEFILALGIVTFLPYLFAALAQFGKTPRTRRTGVLLLAGTQAVLLLNVLSHMGSAVLLRGYAPGMVTSLAVNLPFSLLFFSTALRQGWLVKRNLPWLALAAVLAHSLGLIGLFWLVSELV